MSGSMTGGVDAGIPLQAGRGVQQPNPLQQIGQFAQIQAALNQNKLFPGQQQLQQQAIQGGQTNLANLNNASAYRAIAPLLAGGPITHDSLTSALGSVEGNLGLPTHGVINDIIATAPSGDGPEFDAKVRALIASRAQTSPESAVGMVTAGPGQTLDTGPTLQPTIVAPRGSPTSGVISPAGGSYTKGLSPQYVQTGGENVPTNNGQPTGGAIPNTPSPADMNQLHQVWNPQTKQFDYVPRAGVAPMVNGANQPIPGLPSVGRIQPPATPQAPAATGSAATAPVGTAQELEASAAHLADARNRANNYQATIFPIEGAINALSGADTGKGGETLNSIRGYLGDTPLRYVSNFLPPSLSDQQKRQLYDEAQKYTTGMAIGGPGGARSDAGASASEQANPNVHISNAAAQAVAKSILAQRRMEQAGTLAFNASGQPANGYDRFMNQWNTAQDPRAYALDKMTPEDRAAFAKTLGATNSAPYQKFKASLQAGIHAGVIPDPTGATQ